jgi:type I restriction enzyme S subunit
VPVIRGQNMGRGIVSGEFAFVTPAKAKALQANLAKPLDLVFTQRGTLGQVALVPPAPFDEYLISQSQMKVTIDAAVADPIYVYQYFCSDFGQRQILDSAIQTGVPHTNLGILRSYKVPMPLLVEDQRAIATALTETDSLVDSLEQLLGKKHQVKQGAMQELLTGKRRLPGFGGDWKVFELRQLGRCIRGVAYNPSTDLSEGDGEHTVRLLRSNNVQDGKIVKTGLQYVHKRRVRFDQYLQMDDLLLCMANGSRDLVGKAGRYSAEDEHRYTFGAFMGCYRPDTETVDPKFVSFHFQTHAFRQHIDLLLAGSSINNLRPDGVLSFSINMPRDRDEQCAIAEVLASFDSDAAVLESRLIKARALKQAMAQALLTGRICLMEPTA